MSVRSTDLPTFSGAHWLVALGLALALAWSGPAAPPATIPPHTTEAGTQPGIRGDTDARRGARRLYDALRTARATVSFDFTPASHAIDTLGRSLDVPLIGRYLDDPMGYGIDPTTPIVFQGDDLPVLDVLEEILSQCEREAGPCTWQIRRGFIEVGTKSRLSVPAAREARTYYVGDVIMDIPSNPLDRKRREVVALELVQTVVETIEPGAWDYGQFNEAYDLEEEHTALITPHTPAPGPPAAPAPPGTAPGAAQPMPPAATDAPRPARRYVHPRAIATIRYWRDLLIVTAPDYIHRQINGYPTPAEIDGD